MSVNNGEKNFMTLEEERLLRLKEYAQHVLQSYQKFCPKISQVRDERNIIIIIIITRPTECHRICQRRSIIITLLFHWMVLYNRYTRAIRYRYYYFLSWFQLSSRLSEPIYDCDVSKDFTIITDTVNRYEEDLSLQVLPDFYPEHTNLAMNKKRRISVRIFFSQTIGY